MAGHPLFNPSKVPSLIQQCLKATNFHALVLISLSDPSVLTQKLPMKAASRVVSSPTMFHVKESKRDSSHFNMIP